MLSERWEKSGTCTGSKFRCGTISANAAYHPSKSKAATEQEPAHFHFPVFSRTMKLSIPRRFERAGIREELYENSLYARYSRHG